MQQAFILISESCSAKVTGLLYTFIYSFSLEANFRRRICRVFTISGHGSNLGHVTNSISTHFNFLVPKSFHMKFG